jgi:hypothetical protein
MIIILNKLLILILLGLATAFCSPLKVYILSGQSNMDGLGKMADIIANDSFAEYRTIYPKIKFFLALEGGELTYSDTLKPGSSALQDVGGISGNNTFGPELGIAKILSSKFPNDTMVFIKIPWGGTILETNWVKDQPKPGETVPVYSWFISRVKEALDQLSKSPEGYEIQGVIWLQGEGDGLDSGIASRYSENLHYFVESRLRPDLRNYPAHLINGMVPFVYGRIHNEKFPPFTSTNTTWTEMWPYGDQVQKAQYNAQNEIPCVRCSDTSLIATVWPYGSPDSPLGFGPAHYNTEGVIRVGEGLGRAMVELLSGKKDSGCRESREIPGPNIKNANDSLKSKKPTPVNNTVELQTLENPFNIYALYLVSFPEVKSTSAVLALYNISGTPVRYIRLYKGQNRLTISRRFLPSGCYIIRFKDGEKIGVKKIFWKFSNTIK